MFKIKLTDRATQVRFFRFLLVGGVAAGVQFATLAIWRRFLEPNAAFSLSFICSTATHYTLNRFWALRSTRSDTGRQFFEYLLTVAVSYLVNLAAFALCRGWLGLGVMWAAALAIPPSTLAVFLLLNFAVFRGRSVSD